MFSLERNKLQYSNLDLQSSRVVGFLDPQTEGQRFEMTPATRLESAQYSSFWTQNLDLGSHRHCFFEMAISEVKEFNSDIAFIL